MLTLPYTFLSHRLSSVWPKVGYLKHKQGDVILLDETLSHGGVVCVG